MTQEQKKLLFKLAVKELGFEAYINHDEIEIVTKNLIGLNNMLLGDF